MGKKGIAALVIGVSLSCAAMMIGFIMLARQAAQQKTERDAFERLQLEEDRERVLEREATKADLAAAFTDPQPPTPEEVAEFAPLFAALGTALGAGDAVAVDRLCDLDRLLEDVVRLGGGRSFPGGSGEYCRDFRARSPSWLGVQLFADKAARWERMEIRRVRWSADRREAVLVTTHRDGKNQPSQWRWWLVRRGDRWKMYDNEALTMGVRGCSVIAANATPEMIEFHQNNPGRVDAAMDALMRVEAALSEKNDLVAAEGLIARTRGVPLTGDYLGLIAMYEARVHFARGEHDAALQKLDEAERHSPGMLALRLWRAAAFNSSARYPDALAAVLAYQAELGFSPKSSTAEAYALEGLGRTPEALRAYRRALDEGPDEGPALHGLRRTLPAGEKGEMADRLAKTREPRKLYDELVGAAHRDGDAAGAAALLDGLLKAKPDDPRALGDDVRRKVKAEKFADALAVLTRGLGAKTEADRESVLDAYLFAMIGAGKPLDAYAAVPAAHAKHAFRTLAEDLDDEIDDADGDDPKRLGQLADLVAAHRARVPNDPWTWFFEAAAFWHAKEYEKAEKLLAAGAAKLPAGEPDPDDPDDADRFRERRVECLFKLKKGSAAYRDVGPPEATFRQLAHLYDDANDLTGLTELLALHRKRVPGDPESVYWQAHLHFRKNDLAAAIPLYKAYLRDAGEGARGWRAREELVRAAVRTEPADARRLVGDFGPDQVNAPLRAAVAAAVGDREELERLLAESTRNGKTWFYTDADFRRFIAQEKYRDLRAKYPDPNPPKMEG